MRRPFRPGRPVAAALIALVGVGVGGGGVAASAPSPVAPARQSGDTVRLELVDQQIAFSADGDLRLVFKLGGDVTGVAALTPQPTTPTTPTDDTGQPPAEASEPEEPAPQLSVVVVNYEPLQLGDDPSRHIGRNSRTAAIAKPIDGVVVENGRDLLTFAEDGVVTLDLTVGTDSGESVEERVKFDEPGLYPIVVSLVAGNVDEGEVIASYGTVVQRLPGTGDIVAPRTPIDLAIVTAIGEIGPEPSDAEVATARLGLDATLELTTGVDSPVTMSVPPIVLGGAALVDGATLAEALAGDRLISVPATPLNVSSAAAADVTDAFARQLREGEDLLTAAVPTNVARRDVWIATEPLSSAGAQVVRDLGYRYVVMTPTMFTATVEADLPATDQFVDIILPDGGTLPLLVVDEFGAAMTTEATDEILEAATPIEWSVGALAALILDHQLGNAATERSRILSTPDLAAPDPRLIAELERLAVTTPTVQFAEAGSLLGVTDVQRVAGEVVTVILPDTAGPDLVGRLARLDAAAVAMLSVGSMLPPDDPRPASWAAQIEELVSTGYSEADVDGVIVALTAEADALKGSVVPPEPFSFTLTGRAGDIDLRLTNTSGEPLTVLVRLSSPKLSFPDGDQLVTLRPNEQTMIAVPVRARTNGTSAVEVEVLTPAGEPIDEPVVLTSRVNALTGFGQVLTVGLLLVLLTWWFSHWRARRREALQSEAGEVAGRHPSNGK